ncbi:DeoR family transcriptional regulator [Micromonospora sp. NBC_00389]|uniref:DeoR family transcriptional regulator n=1 Tax=Micromonospora sp. NBC_00389 TaxID=2903586 RepID=UPI002E1B86C3
MDDQLAVRRLSPRRWRVLSFLAQHGLASTLDVALVCAVSRLTAHRDLVWLREAGLVRRGRSAEDCTHTWWYEVTAEGTEVLRRDLTASGRPVPLQLGQRPPGAAGLAPSTPQGDTSRRGRPHGPEQSCASLPLVRTHRLVVANPRKTWRRSSSKDVRSTGPHGGRWRFSRRSGVVPVRRAARRSRRR